jgi:hypothetical protein
MLTAAMSELVFIVVEDATVETVVYIVHSVLGSTNEITGM